MEKRLHVRTYSGPAITALAYQPVRREVVVGFEDGVIKCWELDTMNPAATYAQHKGWITDLLYWNEGKILFSSSIDYTIVQWSSSFIPYHTIQMNGPVYSLLWNPRKEQLICGRDGYISVLLPSRKVSSNGLPIMSYKDIRIDGHSGIVRCLASSDSRVFTGGFDQKLIIYEASSMPIEHSPPLKCIHINQRAHNAGISCIVVAKDTDSSTWVATGSFDQQTKIWTSEGKPLVVIACNAPVTGLAFLPQLKVLWVVAGTSSVAFYEPKLGENVSDHIPILGDKLADRDRDRVNSTLQLLRYVPEVNEVIGSTNRKELLSWCYSTSCSFCIQTSPSQGHIETIAYTNKVPILIFTGSNDGEVTKWERHQLNAFVYSTETLSYKEKLTSHLEQEEGDWNLLEVAGMAEEADLVDAMDDVNLLEKRALLATRKEKARKELMKEEYRGFVKSLFVESLDYLVVSSLDGKIFIWGFDKRTVAVLTEMQSRTASQPGGGESRNTPTTEKDSITSRVAGFTCLHILNGHIGVVSGLALVEMDDNVYLISAGWDSVICVWNLKTTKLLYQLKHNVSTAAASRSATPITSTPMDGLSFPQDSIITDLDYCKERNLFAFSTSDKIVQIYKFSAKKEDLELVGSLNGHFDEVTQVKWNSFIDKWVTASEDGTIRTWAPEGGEECEQFVRVGQPVSLLTIDKSYGFTVAASNNIIRIYDCRLEVVQVSKGHEDNIRDIVHIPELDQYLSAGWDNTLRIWKGHHPKGSNQGV